MRMFPLLVLILCTILAVSLPMTAMAAFGITITETSVFTYNQHFSSITAEKSESSDKAKGSVEINGDTITIKATGYNDCGTIKGSTTSVILTPNANLQVTCKATDLNLVPPGDSTKNSDGTITFVLRAGDPFKISLRSKNQTEVSGSVQFTAVESGVESKVPDGNAAFANLHDNSTYYYLDRALASAESGDTIVLTKSGTLYHSSVERICSEKIYI